ncbi:DnaA N-terminal domain-containing protein [Clostridium saccharobutylicum]|uniref:DnaA N-terminal domain-containing protein n=1 Tax=Clostridium saccharobutylicum TaxID=169679 RepID=UPI0009852EBC|nr:DnaA N-terminal domain-containing protein [Clostridium saccharobutylicum]MBC2436904.1 hypothetical protein [Clostridium saccharobutylicum]NSB89252.1 putative DNA-binding protein [Clostridium saccharobutylicum]NYC27906.1 putative DNA-binding protein [Clostridium saccharobutylicum]
MDNNEIEILRKVISEEITKQLKPIVNAIEELTEEIENFHLYLEAEKREREDTGKCISQDELMNKLGITQEDLDNIEDVEIELQETQNQNEASDAIKKVIKNELSQVSYDTWIAECKGVIEGNILRWFCPNTFTQDITDKRYAKLILNACKLLELDVKEVKILVGNVEKVI